MRYATYGPGGELLQACNDSTVVELPPNAIELTEAQLVQWPSYRMSEDRLSVVELPARPDGAYEWSGSAWVPRIQTKEERIAQILATQGKRKDRLLIQQVIAFVESQAPALATQYAVSLEIALLTLYERNKSYRECKNTETAIEAIEDEA